MLPAETLEMRKRILTLFLAKPRYNIEAISKICKLIIYGDIQYIANSFCKTDKNSDTLAYVVNHSYSL
jgi:hypothetical protein